MATDGSSTSAWMARKSLLVGCILVVIILFTRTFFYPARECIDIVRFVTVEKEVTRKPETTTATEETPFLNLTSRKTVLHFKGLQLYVYSAFFDDRYHENIIRVFALQKKDAPLPPFSCRWHINSKHHLAVPAKRVLVDSSWPTWSHYFAVNYDCNFNKSVEPKEIDLVSDGGHYTFTLPVERTIRLKKRKILGLCIKPVTGTFITPRLIEWFEAQRAAGIKDILLYTTEILGTAQYVVQYYKDLGLVRTLPFPFLMSMLQMLDDPPMEGHVRYALYQQVYLLAMQDCLYRFYGSYEHLLFLDLDEVMLPSPPHKDLQGVITHLRKYYLSAGGFLFMTAWHFEDYGVTNDTSVSDSMYIARYPRATVPADTQPKSIVVTDRAISLNFHSVLDVSDARFSNEVVPWEDVGYIHHYRGLCTIKFEDYRCEDFAKHVRDDPVIPLYTDILVKNTKKVLDKLVLN